MCNPSAAEAAREGDRVLLKVTGRTLARAAGREPNLRDSIMNESASRDKPGGASSSPSIKPLIRAALPPKPVGCRWPFLTGERELRWRRCGKPKCCMGCRKLWGWKRAKCLVLSFATRPPDYFSVIRPAVGMTNAAFAVALNRFMLALRRRVKCLAYFICREWSRGVMHAHGLFRAHEIHLTAVRAAKGLADVRVTMTRAANPIGAAIYVLKAGKQMRPELAPPGFRGRLLLISRDFLSESFVKLWKAAKAEYAARKGGAA